ncbi:MAG: sensor histidine kinase [Ferrimicrobium sp.]
MLERILDDLEGSQRSHLAELLRFWGFLADLGFSDLTICIPTGLGSSPGYVIAAQVRPATAQTVHPGDLVGMYFDLDPASPIGRCLEHQVVTSDDRADSRSGRPVRSWFIPLIVEGRCFAVLVRDQLREQQRNPGGLESTYMELFARFTQMIVEERFPYPPSEVEEGPRVGDGVTVLDEEERIQFLSPNAVSALHRLGCPEARVGSDLEHLGLRLQAPSSAGALGVPVLEEVERPRGVTVTFYCLPMFAGARLTGYVLLLRDVTDLRQRERLLASKDATIREVHHRVKNNLQTISSLLRLQRRRVGSVEAQQALAEAERRIRAIAVVHEFLSRDISEQVEIDAAIHALIRLAQESKLPGRNLSVSVEGAAGKLAAAKVTPLALVMAELLQNALEHGYGSRLELAVSVVLERNGTDLLVEISDDGVGMPPDLDPQATDSLGLAIVRDLVVGQLEGAMRIESAAAGGTRVVIRIPA